MILMLTALVTADAGGCNSAGMPIYSFKSMLSGFEPTRYAIKLRTASRLWRLHLFCITTKKDSDQNAVFSGWNLVMKWTTYYSG